MPGLWWTLWWALWVPLQYLGGDTLRADYGVAFSPSGRWRAELRSQGIVLRSDTREAFLPLSSMPPVLGVVVSDSFRIVVVREAEGPAVLLEAMDSTGQARWSVTLPAVLGLRFSQDSRWLLVGTPTGLLRFSNDGRLQGRYPLAPVYEARGPWVALAEGYTLRLYRDTTLRWQVPLGMNRVRALRFSDDGAGLVVFTARQLLLLDTTGQTRARRLLPGDYVAGAVGPWGAVVSAREGAKVVLYRWNLATHEFHPLLTLRPYRIGVPVQVSGLGVRGDTLWILKNAKVLRYLTLQGG